MSGRILRLYNFLLTSSSCRIIFPRNRKRLEFSQARSKNSEFWSMRIKEGNLQLMTVEDVAEYLRIKTSTVYEWAGNGKLSDVKVNRLLLAKA